MVIVTTPDGTEINRMAGYLKIDVDLNVSRDFEISLPSAAWDTGLYSYGNRVFIPDSELGGIIGKIKTDTAEDKIIISGMTWRGILAKKIIKPPAGQDYKIVSGELNTVIRNLITECGLDSLFFIPDIQTAASVSSYQFDRYTTLLDGINKMLKSEGYKLKLSYIRGEGYAGGYVELEAVQVIDYSEDVELSQNNRLKFIFEEIRNGVNHLVCLGKGELAARIIVDLYVQGDGSVGTIPYYTGLEEITEVYELSSEENIDELTSKGTEKLLELMNRKVFKMDIGTMGLETEIGDIIGGRDYITGMSMAKPIINKVYTEQNGTAHFEYKLEGEE